jgi:DNA polymerase-3 subunit delta
MKIYPEKLDAALREQRSRQWLVSGDEPLLVSECCDAIRAAARLADCGERVVFFVERGFDWAALREAAASLSLFATRRLIEVRLPSGKAGTEGSALLAQALSDTASADWWLIVTGRLDSATQSAAWVKAADAQGIWVTVYAPEAQRLPQWIAARCQRVGLQADDDAVQMLARRVQGNLLAAQQEIAKLRLLVSGSRLDVDAVQNAVADSARFDVDTLIVAALRADAPGALRTLAGLRAEGEEPTLIVWALAREIESLLAVSNGREQANNSRGGGGRWRPPALAAAFESAQRRSAKLPFTRLAARLTRADRMIKGRLAGDAWDELALLAAELAGLTPLTAPRPALAK